MLVPCCRTRGRLITNVLFLVCPFSGPYFFLTLPTGFAADAMGNARHGLKQEDAQPSWWMAGLI